MDGREQRETKWASPVGYFAQKLWEEVRKAVNRNEREKEPSKRQSQGRIQHEQVGRNG